MPGFYTVFGYLGWVQVRSLCFNRNIKLLVSGISLPKNVLVVCYIKAFTVLRDRCLESYLYVLLGHCFNSLCRRFTDVNGTTIVLACKVSQLCPSLNLRFYSLLCPMCWRTQAKFILVGERNSKQDFYFICIILFYFCNRCFVGQTDITGLPHETGRAGS